MILSCLTGRGQQGPCSVIDKTAWTLELEMFDNPDFLISQSSFVLPPPPSSKKKNVLSSRVCSPRITHASPRWFLSRSVFPFPGNSMARARTFAYLALSLPFSFSPSLRALCLFDLSAKGRNWRRASNLLSQIWLGGVTTKSLYSLPDVPKSEPLPAGRRYSTWGWTIPPSLLSRPHGSS